ncbi:hypothetical protein, partial [Thiolapillus sp.]|uniref:hypothetical protein n=1 Tax=Thiolapillus sp. TaxID=2017437 RepID=UPI003AF8D952
MFSLWRKARRENSAASRLLGSTSLRFALHGWQRLVLVDPRAGGLEQGTQAGARGLADLLADDHLQVGDPGRLV